jgi:hypothetical protein
VCSPLYGNVVGQVGQTAAYVAIEEARRDLIAPFSGGLAVATMADPMSVRKPSMMATW